MICPSCASENTERNAYCGTCGTILDDSKAAVPRYADGRRLIKREMVVLAGGIGGLLFAGWVAWYFLVATKSPARVVTAFIEADRTSQFSRQQPLVANSWDNRMALTLFQGLRQQAGSSPFQTYRILQTNEGRGDAATVDVELTLPQPTIPLLAPPVASAPGTASPNVKMPVTFVLKREGDEWKIDSSQTLASVMSALVAQGFQQFKFNAPAFPNIPMPNGWPNVLAPPGATTPAPTAPSTGFDSSL